MTSPAHLALWWQPGRHMAPAWWHRLGLAAWLPYYSEQPGLRPPLDRLLAARLGHDGPPPPADALADQLLIDCAWRESLCLSLGLWVLACPDYLLLRPYRQALSPSLLPRQQGQLLALLPPSRRRAATLAPALLPKAARQAGSAWLARAAEPGLALCRLLWPPSVHPAPDAPVGPVLRRLARWL